MKDGIKSYLDGFLLYGRVVFHHPGGWVKTESPCEHDAHTGFLLAIQILYLNHFVF